ncbi:hypothetical protein K7X08_012779 [Anisodus acutangulus]|uniref:BHLH domain-containing protein n=1 Tax=Anisodus acutangulus TaxID=402998 RepID=A0A9Q1M9S0_9SOLA|nr:hypothetical protein K7X08_012779 [Anisodus acutangulus]
MASLSYYSASKLEPNIQELNSEMEMQLHPELLFDFVYDDELSFYNNPEAFCFDPFFDPDEFILPVETTHNSSFMPEYSIFEKIPMPVFSTGCCNNNAEVVVKKGGSNNNEKKMSAQSIMARQRRKKITEKTQELGKLIPGGHRMNTAEMLQATFKYIKFLQAQAGLLEFMGSYQENEKSFQITDLHKLVGSSLIQEKLYTSEKCLIPKVFLEAPENNHEVQNSQALESRHFTRRGAQKNPNLVSLLQLQEMGEEVKGAVPVPESVLKKQKRNEEWALAKTQVLVAAKKKSAENRKLIYNRAKQYASEYEQQEKELIRLKREARLKGGFYVDPEAKLLFIVRIRGINAMPPQTKKILQLLRLRQIFNGVFLKVNKATVNMLHRVEPYVTYGYPNLKSIRELIYKRGYGKVDKQRIALTDNAVIEQVLGKYGIICMEDLVHEIMTVGPHFKEANNFLWPFQLKAPLGGMKKKRNHYVEGGDAGNRENFINELIRRMN